MSIIGLPEEREQGIENLLEEIMTENPNLAMKIDIQAKEAQRVLKKMNPKRPIPRHHN